MSPAAKIPGMLVSIVEATLMSPLSSSSPHSAMAPSEERKPSWGMTASTATCSSSLRSEEHTSELQSRLHLVCRLLLEKKKKKQRRPATNSAPNKHNSPELRQCQKPF